MHFSTSPKYLGDVQISSVQSDVCHKPLVFLYGQDYRGNTLSYQCYLLKRE